MQRTLLVHTVKILELHHMCHMYSFPCKAKYNFLNLNIFIFGEKIWNKLRSEQHDTIWTCSFYDVRTFLHIY